MTELEKTVQKHLQESGYIQSNLKFNTWLTGGIALAIIGQWVKSFFH